MTGRLEFCVAGGRAAAKHVSRESVREMAERFMLSRDKMGIVNMKYELLLEDGKYCPNEARALLSELLY